MLRTLHLLCVLVCVQSKIHQEEDYLAPGFDPTQLEVGASVHRMTVAARSRSQPESGAGAKHISSSPIGPRHQADLFWL